MPLFFPGEVHQSKYFFFVPESVINKRTEKGYSYDQWVRDGSLIVTPGNVTDYNFVKAKILEICELYDVKSIGYDRWNASQLVIDLVEEKIPMSPFGQGYASMSAPTKQLEKMVINKEINHAGNAVMRWMISNVMIKPDPAGNIKVDKAKSKEKIDGVVGLIMAIGEWMIDGRPQESVYETRGIVSIEDFDNFETL